MSTERLLHSLSVHGRAGPGLLIGATLGLQRAAETRVDDSAAKSGALPGSSILLCDMSCHRWILSCVLSVVADVLALQVAEDGHGVLGGMCLAIAS